MIENIINEKGKNCRSLTSKGEILPNTYLRKIHSSFYIAKKKSLMLKENLRPIQSYVANILNCSVSTINKIATSDLNL